MGVVAGYVSAHIYKSEVLQCFRDEIHFMTNAVMGGLKWKSSILKTALFVPGYIFLIFSGLSVCLCTSIQFSNYLLYFSISLSI